MRYRDATRLVIFFFNVALIGVWKDRWERKKWIMPCLGRR